MPRSAIAIPIRIRRQDGPDKSHYWEEFAVAPHMNANVISCLMQITADPVTICGKRTTPPVWQSGCLEEMCGACTMLVNGKPCQACSALVEKISPNGEPITLEPLTKFPVVRDLHVDRKRLFDDLKRIKGWMPAIRTSDQGAGPPISIELQKKLYELTRCISCGCCLEACPQYLPANNFLGAAVFSQALRFNCQPGGERLKPKRLDALMGRGGVTDCNTTGNCGPICPKGLPHTTAIDAVAKLVRAHGLKRIKAVR